FDGSSRGTSHPWSGPPPLRRAATAAVPRSCTSLARSRIEPLEQSLHGVEGIAVDALFLVVADQVREFHSQPEFRDPRGHDFGGEWGGQLDAARVGGRKRLTPASEHARFPGPAPRP